MDIIAILNKNGYQKIECGLIRYEGDDKKFRRQIRKTGSALNVSGVYVFTALDRTGKEIPMYVGSSLYVKHRVQDNRVIRRILSDSTVGEVSLYVKPSELFLYDESILIETIKPLYNVNRPWRPREHSIII